MHRSLLVQGLSILQDKDAAMRQLAEKPERFALVALAGRQFKVVENDVIVCNKLKVRLVCVGGSDAHVAHVARSLVQTPERRDVQVGDRVLLDEVLLVGSDGPVLFGLPLIEPSAVTVTATVIEQGKSEKQLIIKKKRRKNYKRTFGHRQHLTALRIHSIQVHHSGSPSPAATQA